MTPARQAPESAADRVPAEGRAQVEGRARRAAPVVVPANRPDVAVVVAAILAVAAEERRSSTQPPGSSGAGVGGTGGGVADVGGIGGGAAKSAWSSGTVWAGDHCAIPCDHTRVCPVT